VCVSSFSGQSHISAAVANIVLETGPPLLARFHFFKAIIGNPFEQGRSPDGRADAVPVPEKAVERTSRGNFTGMGLRVTVPGNTIWNKP
jgi:hypothetical protein